MSAPANLFRRHHFPGEIISHCVWLYFQFSLSYRDIELMMAERGIVLTYEAVRDWCRKFGPYFASEVKRRNRSKVGSKWHLDGGVSQDHRQHRYLNNRAENSHQPTRQRERRMKKFKSPEQAQWFLSTFDTVGSHFRMMRHRLSAERHRSLINAAFLVWNEIAGLAAVRS
ncbi:MAG: IS6 family transposase [Bryobacteraceae bacterium]